MGRCSYAFTKIKRNCENPVLKDLLCVLHWVTVDKMKYSCEPYKEKACLFRDWSHFWPRQTCSSVRLTLFNLLRRKKKKQHGGTAKLNLSNRTKLTPEIVHKDGVGSSSLQAWCWLAVVAYLRCVCVRRRCSWRLHLWRQRNHSSNKLLFGLNPSFLPLSEVIPFLCEREEL